MLIEELAGLGSELIFSVFQLKKIILVFKRMGKL